MLGGSRTSPRKWCKTRRHRSDCCPRNFPAANEVMRANAQLRQICRHQCHRCRHRRAGISRRERAGAVAENYFHHAKPREKYDFAATLPHGASAALQQELRTKLGFVARRETARDGHGRFASQVKRPDAPQSKPTTGKMGNISGSSGNGPSSLKCDNQPSRRSQMFWAKC